MVLGEINQCRLKRLLENDLKLENGVSLQRDLLMAIYSELDRNTLNEYNITNPNAIINIALNYLLDSLKDNETNYTDDFWKNNFILINRGVETIAEKYFDVLYTGEYDDEMQETITINLGDLIENM